MGVLEPLHLVPEGLHLLLAVGLDFLEAGPLIHQPAALEYGDLEGLRGEVRVSLPLPGGPGIEELQAPALVHLLVPDGDIIRLGLAGGLVKNAVDLFEMGIGDLVLVFADLDLGNHRSRPVLQGHQLVHPAEDRLAAGGNHPLAHAEQVHLGPLDQQIPDDIFVQGVGGGDPALRPARAVQHLPGLLGEVGDVAGIQADAALLDAQGLQHRVKGPDGVRHAGFQGVVGVHQQRRVVGVEPAVRFKRLVLGVEHLDPGVGHGAPGGHVVELVGDGAGRPGAAADIRRPGPGDGPVGALGPAGAEFQHRPPLGRPDDAVGLGGDEALVVDGQQRKRLDELGLDGGGTDRHDRLLGEDGGPLGDCPDVAGEAEVLQVGQKLLGEQVPSPEVGDVLLVEVQVQDIADELIQARADGEAPLVRHVPEEHVEIGCAVLKARLEIAVAHGQLVKIAEHGHVQLLIGAHGGNTLFLSCSLDYKESALEMQSLFWEKSTKIRSRPAAIISGPRLWQSERRLFQPQAGKALPVLRRRCMSMSKITAKNRGFYGKFSWRFAVGYDTFILRNGSRRRTARFRGAGTGRIWKGGALCEKCCLRCCPRCC